MTDTPRDAADESTSETWERRRRLAEVFGDVLPETTTDEREPGAQPQAEDAGEAWLKSQVPPHHG